MRSFVLVLGALVAGCGKPPAENPPQPTRSEPAPQTVDRRPVVAAFGNSLSAGFGVDPGSSYPDFLQQELDRRGYRYRVVNAGISGDTTSGGLARVDAVTALHPVLVILELGANDGLRGVPLAVTRSNLERIIEALQGAGARVVLAGMTLPPNYGPDYIRGFEKIYKDLAARYRLRLIPFLLEGVALEPGMMQSDGLHPNTAGYRKVAANVMRVVEPLLAR